MNTRAAIAGSPEYSTLWRAIDHQAATWRRTETIKRFIHPLPRNATSPRSPLTKSLEHFQAAGRPMLANPMVYGTSIPFAMPLLERWGGRPSGPEWDDWLDVAARVDTGHRRTVAWLRSRLPGYPLLPAPQLAPGSSLTTPELSGRLGWMPGELAAGLAAGGPPQVDAVLRLTRSQSAEFDLAAWGVAEGLRGSAPWVRLASAADGLDRMSREQLLAARRTIRDRLAPAVLARTPMSMLDCAELRATVMEQEVQRLDGAAREYADAFDGAERLVEEAGSEVFGQLVAYSSPHTVGPPRDLDLGTAESGAVAFTLDHFDHLVEPSSLVWVDDELLVDAVRIVGVNLSTDNIDTHMRITARTLEGTGGAWRPSTEQSAALAE